MPAHVFAASLLNGEAVVDRIERTFPNETVPAGVLGVGGQLNLEDFYGAGYLGLALRAVRQARERSDASLAAQMLHDGADAFECLASRPRGPG